MSDTGHRSDPALVQACLREDGRAWAELVERYGRLVYSIARRYGLRDDEADDVHQNVFVILFRRLETLADHTRLSAWLITTTHRECWRHRRRTRPLAEVPEDHVQDESTPAGEEIEAREREHLVRFALEQIGAPCDRLLMALFRHDGQTSYAAVAEQLGMKVGGIGPTRARCFAKLERLLIELGLAPPGDDPSPIRD